MSDLLKAGRYKGRPTQWAFVKTNNGLGINVAFDVEVPDAPPRTIYWSGYLYGGARENSFKALLYCGLNTDDFSVIAKGSEGKALNVDQEVDLAIVVETFKDKDGNEKTLNKVNWVNQIGGTPIRNALPEAEVVAMAGAANLRAELQAIAAKINYKIGAAPVAQAAKPPIDIPF